MKKHLSKLGLISSKGGHLYQLYLLKDWWTQYPRFWITYPGSDTADLLKNEVKEYGYYPETRHAVNAILNFFLAMKLLRKYRPTHLASCGAGLAVPFFLVGKILGVTLIYIEPYDFIDHPTLTGRILYQVADVFLVQHAKQKKHFPKAIFVGATL